jgi:hypothetical protein
MRWGSKREPANRMPPAAWYPDPHNASQLRYWDGAAWTDHCAPAGSPVIASAVEAQAPAAATEVVQSSPVVGLLGHHPLDGCRP